MVELLVFLGNPGKHYERTRHNFGFLLCTSIPTAFSWQEKCRGLLAKDGNRLLLKPQTFMNESGMSVRLCMDFFKIPAERILVAHDDLELPFGTVRLQKGGGLQGHNGLRSIKAHLKTDAFYRLRLGIGRPEHGPVASYVLSPFSKEERALLPDILSGARHMLETGEEGTSVFA